MLVVISDLHFQDTRNDAVQDNTSGATVNVDRNVPANAFYLIFEELFAVARAKQAKELIVVLAGDIFDLNRSARWQLTPDRPYDEAASPPATWGPVASAILEDIVLSNQETFDVLKSLRNPDSFIAAELKQPSLPVQFAYIPGNHDRIVNLHPPLAQRVREIFGLPGEGRFGHEVLRNDYGVHIRHGHEYDKQNFAGAIPDKGPFNVAEKDYDRAPLGDFVTIELAAGLAYEYRKAYLGRMQNGDRTCQEVYCKLLEFDDLRPQADVVDFLDIAWDSLIPVADNVIKRALGNKFLQSRAGAWGKLFPLLKHFPMKLIPTKFLIKWLSGMKSDGPELWEFAKREPALNTSSGGPTFLYAVSGHTHDPDVEFLPQRATGQEKQERFFFDTGTWRQQIRKCCGERTFSKAKALTYVVFYRQDENVPRGSERAGFAFDYWSGYQKKA